MKNTYRRKIISGVIAGIFLFTNIAYPKTSPQPVPTAPQKPKICLIGDIHTHYEVQKQIINHIRTLNKESGTGLIFTEGSFGYLDLSDIDIFRQIQGAQKAIEEVSEKYLKAGKISADEYLRVIDGPKYEIYGIDDMRRYREIEVYFKGRAPNQTKEESLKVNAEREKTMIDNLAREMARRGEKAAFMTIGTFHIRSMAGELQKRGFDVVILPMRYDMNFDKSIYENIQKRNEKLKMYWKEGLKLSAVTERVEWQELQGEILETAVKNTYDAGGITAVKSLVGQVNTLAGTQGKGLGPFSVVEDAGSGTIYVVGKNILTIVNESSIDSNVFAQDAMAAGISRSLLFVGEEDDAKSIFIPEQIAESVRTNDDLSAFMANPRADRIREWTLLGLLEAQIKKSAGIGIVLDEYENLDPADRVMVIIGLAELVENERKSQFFNNAKTIADDIIVEPSEKAKALRDIATAETKAGLFADAKTTAGCITDSYWKASALRNIATAEAGAGFTDDARTTFADAKTTAGYITDSYWKASALRDIAKAEVKAGYHEAYVTWSMAKNFHTNIKSSDLLALISSENMRLFLDANRLKIMADCCISGESRLRPLEVVTLMRIIGDKLASPYTSVMERRQKLIEISKELVRKLYGESSEIDTMLSRFYAGLTKDIEKYGAIIDNEKKEQFERRISDDNDSLIESLHLLV